MAPVFKASNKKQDDGNRHHQLAIKALGDDRFHRHLLSRTDVASYINGDVSLFQVLVI